MDLEKVKLWVLRLGLEYDQVCFSYRTPLKRPVIQITEMQSRWGLWEPDIRTISLSYALIQEQPWGVVVEVLKHEMAHQVVTETYGADEGHGPLFHRACAALGVAVWARRAESELGELPPDWKTPVVGSAEERLLQRVEKLLRLANSSNTFESIAAMKKVQELYLKYRLDLGATAAPGHQVYLQISLKKKRCERFQSAIASLLHDFFHVEVIHTRQYDTAALTDYKVIEILGRKEDVLLAEYVFYFLSNQLPILWAKHVPTLPAIKNYGGTSERKKKNSFYLGVLSGFREKLEQNQLEISRQDSSLALVLKRDDKELGEFLRFRHPRLVSIKHGRVFQDGSAYDAGKVHGRKLTLKKGLDTPSDRRQLSSGRSFLPRK